MERRKNPTPLGPSGEEEMMAGAVNHSCAYVRAYRELIPVSLCPGNRCVEMIIRELLALNRCSSEILSYRRLTMIGR